MMGMFDKWLRKTIEIHIEASQERVFEFLTDFDAMQQALTKVDRVELTSTSPIGVGSKWQTDMQIGSNKVTFDCEMTDFNPPVSYSFDSQIHGFHTDTTYAIFPKQNGVLFEVTAASRLTNPYSIGLMLGSWVMSLFQGTKNFDDSAAFLADVKTAIEATA